ncbi:MAG: hypothetical protein LBO69_08090 [Ignavibacteria bacterium]|jgi:hypothetical protein|nr:hypothetical protein [Ignavibacteria bacterium]
MKKIIHLIIIAAFTFIMVGNIATAQIDLSPEEEGMIRALNTLDNEIVRYFPRWKVCEPSLQIHIYQAFRNAGYSADSLDQGNIEVLAAPGGFDTDYGYYQILLVSCGVSAMSPYQVSTYFTSLLSKELSGEYSYSGTGYGRTYCYKDIPPEAPVSSYQADAIINYYQPTDVTHAISLSLFEQDLKIGETGFWLRSIFGNDEAGYQFWSSGQAGIELQRPLYINKDVGTSRAIPYLINFYFGGGYRITSGISSDGTIFSWLPDRTLNGSQSGDLIMGLNFHLPIMPQIGLSFHARIPIQSPNDKSIDPSKWGKISLEDIYTLDETREVYTEDGNITITHVMPMMHSSGKVSVFYNWWLDSRKPENYIRGDLGLCYVETREVALANIGGDIYNNMLAVDGINGLKTYKPHDFMDWLYIRLEYRNQATWPFGASVQIANQTLLGNVWVPILGNWLLLEMKYSTVLRDARPYELKNFFMFSPVIRITI